MKTCTCGKVIGNAATKCGPCAAAIRPVNRGYEVATERRAVFGVAQGKCGDCGCVISREFTLCAACAWAREMRARRGAQA